MAHLIWTEPALADIETIADYIALDTSRGQCGVVNQAGLTETDGQEEAGKSGCRRDGVQGVGIHKMDVFHACIRRLIEDGNGGVAEPDGIGFTLREGTLCSLDGLEQLRGLPAV